MDRVVYNSSQLLENGSGRIRAYTLHDDALILSNPNPFRNGHYISGGPFYVRHRRHGVVATAPRVKGTFNGTTLIYDPFIGTAIQTSIVPHTTTELLALRDSSLANANAYGATAWKRSRPGNPVAGISNFLLELRDIPRLPLRLFMQLKNFRSLGNEYLNVNFGWLPFVSDVRKMYQLYRTIDTRLAQIVRDNGKGVHRRRIIKDESSKTLTNTAGGGNFPFHGWAHAPGISAPGYGKVEIFTTTYEKVWFVGRFRYYIPDIGSSEWTKRATRALYGVNVTPEVLWNALPWSWLIDWFTNLGDIVSNASSNAVDNLTADYAYIMREFKSSTEWVGTGWCGTNSTWKSNASSASLTVETSSQSFKSRSAASPFGFGTTFEGLTPYQLSIAAALGISRWA